MRSGRKEEPLQVKRTENKFLLNSRESLLLRSRMEAILPRDKHCVSPEGYEIRSLYFDTISDRAYAEKEEGLRYHEKIRARIYGTDDSVIKLESKQKDGALQTKTSLLIDRSTLEALSRGNYSCLLKMDDPTALYFYRKLSQGMRPKAIIQYRRLSYCLPANNTRITFDTDIRATESCLDLFQEPLQAAPIFPSDHAILEVKFNNFLFDYIKRELNGMGKLPTSFSKYAGGRRFARYMI